MTDITPDAQFDNFFALFEQPVQFAVNQERLDQLRRCYKNAIIRTTLSLIAKM